MAVMFPNKMKIIALLFDQYQEPPLSKMPFGKWKGMDVSDLPTSYLEWLHKQSDPSAKLRHAIAYALLERGKVVIIKEKDKTGKDVKHCCIWNDDQRCGAEMRYVAEQEKANPSLPELGLE